LPDLDQPFRGCVETDDQRLFQVFQLVRQRNARHQRHVRGADAAVGEIDRGRRLRGAGHTDQHHVGILEAFDMLAVIMDHRIVQRIDAFEILGIQHVLRADAPGSRSAEIGFE
jgi:hypothetical protein